MTLPEASLAPSAAGAVRPARDWEGSAGDPATALSSSSSSSSSSGDRPPLVSVAGLGVHVGGRWLLRDVDLTVEPGEIVTLIGPNGAGKTTLVKAILGLVPHATGRVRRLPSRAIGYLPQKVALDPVLPLTVRRLVTATRRLPEARVRAVLGECGVAGLIGAPVQGLSGGELQRVLLARALLRDPRLLVLDEPVQGVDTAGEAALYDLIAAVRRRRGCGVLMVSHDLHVVMAATDRVVCLNGRVCCSGSPRKVTGEPAFHALFGPRAQALAVYPHDHSIPADPRPPAEALPAPPAHAGGCGPDCGCGASADVIPLPPAANTQRGRWWRLFGGSDA